MDYYKIGQKIRNFRKRAGLSQMELENMIDMSPGGISRIENGEVNPTKETIQKISNALNLNVVEIASLQNLEILSPEEVMNAISIFTRPLILEEIIKNAVDVLFELYPEYNGGVLLLVDDSNKNILRARGLSEMPNVSKIYEILGGKVDKYFFRLNENTSLITKTFIEGKAFSSNNLVDFAKGSMNDSLPKAAAMILGFGIGISVPLVFENEKIGAMLYTKRSKDGFSEYEKNILTLLSNQIAIAIMIGKKFEALTNK